MEDLSPRTAHQSMKGMPRCGVAIQVKLAGVYSLGLICVMSWRQSSPPIEYAIRLTSRCGTFSTRSLCRFSARSTTEPVLKRDKKVSILVVKK